MRATHIIEAAPTATVTRRSHIQSGNASHRLSRRERTKKTNK
jgi:hypothetical protein